jgi:hypothetical protein
MDCLAWGWCLVVFFILGSFDPPTPYVFFVQGFVCRVSVRFDGGSFRDFFSGLYVECALIDSTISIK